MNGASVLCKSFPKKEQIGKLFVFPGSHARGKTFRIYVLPEGVEAISFPHMQKDAVEVYGVTGGHAGWNETYGWLYCGAWEDDFNREHQRRVEVENDRLKKEVLIKDADNAVQESLRIKGLLGEY